MPATNKVDIKQAVIKGAGFNLYLGMATDSLEALVGLKTRAFQRDTKQAVET